LVLFPMMRTRLAVGRPEGAVLVAAYLVYVTLLVMGG
jgi:hypothetical protein